MANPLVDDRTVSFLLHDVLDAASLLRLPHFEDHSKETFEAYLGVCRRFARETLYPTYRVLDAEPPRLVDGRVVVPALTHDLFGKLRDLGTIAAARPAEVGGQQLPLTIATAAHLYLMAAGAAPLGFLALTTGAAHLVETFGSDELKAWTLGPLYEGRWTGTMALTEPQAGSSLADVAARARPEGDHYLLSGAKMFISGGDHDLTENIVHLALARIDGAPAGIKGVSLFLVPKARPDGSGGLAPNDVRVAGLIHKIGWRALPSVALSLGDAGDCHGWLVGPPHQGIAQMFQMMNEARISVGANGVATASVAYHESLAYARERLQGRPSASKDPREAPVPIVEHADVRRMLLRQKAIVEGGLALVLTTALLSDRAAHAVAPEERQRAQLLLDLLTPVAKSFPAERGFEATVLGLQVHGGYGYTSEYLAEAFVRDQKLNSIHEGTTGIQGLDLLGRKVLARDGAALALLGEEIAAAARRAGKARVDPALVDAVTGAAADVASLTREMAVRTRTGDVDAFLRHSADYLDLFSTVVIAWQWLLLAAASREALAAGRGPAGFFEGKLAAADYWARTELPRAAALIALCRSNEDSYARMRPDWF